MRGRNAILLRASVVAGVIFSGNLVAAALGLTVVDEQGQPVPSFEFMINTAAEGCTKWEKCEQGVAKIPYGFDRAQVIDLLVRAEGFTAAIVRFEGEKRAELLAGTAAVALQRGQPVELRLQLPEGMNWPEGLRPEVYFADIQHRARIMRQPSNRKEYSAGAPELDFNMLVQPKGAETFTLQLATNTPPFYLAIHSLGFLQYFETGPYTLADVKDGVLEIAVPRPAQLNFQFQAEGDPETLPFRGVNLDVLIQMPGLSGSYLQVAREKRRTPQLVYSLNDLAPGDYRFGVGTEPKPEIEKLPGTRINPGKFHDIRKVSLKAGQTERIDIEYAPPDLESYRGDRTAVLRFERPDGTPATGEAVDVQFLDAHYGEMPVFAGKVPESGEITLENLTGRAPPDWPHGPYLVRGNNKRLGHFGFASDRREVEATFSLPPQVGDLAPNVAIIEIATGRVVKLADFRGKVVWIEFWATWCGPCQQPMQELDQMAAEHAEKWSDRVAIIPLSIDDEVNRVKPHTVDRGWGALSHYWAGGNADSTGFESRSPRAFGVQGVPTAFLIDREGRILWYGHPLGDEAGEKVEERINAAIE